MIFSLKKLILGVYKLLKLYYIGSVKRIGKKIK